MHNQTLHIRLIPWKQEVQVYLRNSAHIKQNWQNCGQLKRPLEFLKDRKSNWVVPIFYHFLLALLTLDVFVCNSRNPPSISVFMLYVKIQQQQRSWWFRKLKHQNSVSRFTDNNTWSRQYYKKKQKQTPENQVSAE